MNNKTEDRFYFGQPGGKAKFDANAPWMSEVNRMLRDLSRERAKIQIWISGSDSVTTAGSSRGSDVRYSGTTWLVAGRIARYLKFAVPGSVEQHTEQKDYPKKGLSTSFYKVSNLPKELIAYLKNWGIGTSPKSFSGFSGTSAVAYSRPGQPERFAEGGDAKISGSNVEIGGVRYTIAKSRTLEQLSEGEQKRVKAVGRSHWIANYDLRGPKGGRSMLDVYSNGVYILTNVSGAGRVKTMRGLLASRPGQPERFGMAEQVMRDGSVHLDFSAARDYLAKQSNDGLRYIIKDARAARDAGGTNGKKFNYYADLVLEAQQELKKRGFSRSSQKSEMSREDGNYFVIRGYVDGFIQGERSFDTQQEAEYYGKRMLEAIKQNNPKGKQVTVNIDSVVNRAPSKTVKTLASRPGQPERFDASSLDRGNFADASKSPMLGKLLSEKTMPDGGWRAVQVGSDTLVISFEDADLARDFGRRAASKGYSATSPVATTGRYWNVEVKNDR